MIIGNLRYRERKLSFEESIIKKKEIKKMEVFFSPLEQFEFTLISGKLLKTLPFHEYLSPLDKEYNDENLGILLGDSPYREQIKEEVEKYFNFILGLVDPRMFGMERDALYEIIVTESLKNELLNNTKDLYKNLDFFYSEEPGLELVAIYVQVFNELVSDNSLVCLKVKFSDWFLILTLEELDLRKSRAFEYEEESFAILAGDVLTDLYTNYKPYGVNPTLHNLIFNFYGWVIDRIVLNEISVENCGEDWKCTISDYINNVRALSALEMNDRDYSAISFYWLNIYNSLFIVITLIILIFIIFNQGYIRISNVWQILNTLTFDFLLKSFISLANKNLINFYPIFFCFFIFIYLLNLTALTPFSFCLTSNLWFSLSLSFSVWFGVTTLAIMVRGEQFFTGFVPSNISSNELKAFITVIEVISYVARALSLGVRIFANMLAGHSLVHILSDLTATCFVEFDNIGLKIFGIFPAIILSFILVIEFGICFLQGLVFVILTAIYLKEAFEGH